VSLSVAGTLDDTDGMQALGQVAIAERTPDGLTDGQYTLTVTDPGVAFDFPTYTDSAHPSRTFFGVSSGVNAMSTTTSGAVIDSIQPAYDLAGARPTAPQSITFGLTSSDPGLRETLYLSGLRLTGVSPRAAVHVTLSPPPTYPGAVAENAVTATVPVATAADRIAGSNRYDTAARVDARFGTAPGVVVANGTTAKGGFDALAANYLAGQRSAPIVLTEADAIPPYAVAAVQAALQGTSSPTIDVLGAKDSVSDFVVQQLVAAAATVTDAEATVRRTAGSDRYVTAALAAQAGQTVGAVRFGADEPAVKTAILASGQVNADALAAGPLSDAWGLPVLLTGPDTLPQATRDAIAALGIGQLLVLGGTDRISEQVVAQAVAAGVSADQVRRIAGSNRFDTSAQLYAFARDAMIGPDGQHYGAGSGSGDTAYLANGLTGFPDALAAGPLAAQHENVLLTVEPSTLPAPVDAFLRAHRSGLVHVIALGAPPTVAQSVIAQATAAIG
jgi:putative cell wall-binding protein